MSYRAKVVEIMIASPTDVVPERHTIRNVIQEWNATHSAAENLVLMPIGWESHSIPAMGGRPQAILNKQILASCDLLIAVFWTKLGTPTGKAASGTVEEIEEHLKAKKPAIIYFSTIPVVPEMVNKKQYQALQAFKQEIGKRGLYTEYNSTDDFRDKLTRQLAQTVVHHFTSRKNGNGHRAKDAAIVRPYVPEVSGSARYLLMEATDDPTGLIFRTASSTGLEIDTNRHNMVESQQPSCTANWQRALMELKKLGLIEDRGNRGQVFVVTEEGYRAVDLLRERHFVG